LTPATRRKPHSWSCWKQPESRSKKS